MKVVITGSSGHSGKEIARLLAPYYEIGGIDLLEGQYTTRVGSLSDRDFVMDAVASFDAIIHTAALHAPHVPTHSREAFIDTNIKGTLYLLEACQEHGIKKFIYTSTTSLYGRSLENEDQAVWVTEELPVRPRDIYDITKVAAEELCRDFFDKTNLQTIVLRVSRFWNEPDEKKVFYRMYRGLDVRDVAQAHQLAIETDLDQFDIFNISAQSIFTPADLNDLRNNTMELLQSRIPELIEYYKTRNWDMPSSIDRVYVIEKAKGILKYNPRYNIKELLEGE
ncbi:MAG: NAD(P)-dependent oxidoreductase [Bacteroidota bacterium]